jgi:methionyl-tRNA formyltransferase
MQVTPELDAGDIYICREFDIGIDDTNDTIEALVSKIGSEILIDYLQNPSAYPAMSQVGEPTFTHKWTGVDEMIDWSRGDIAVHNQIRALGAGRTKINGMDVKILQTKLNGDKLEILQLQPSGKKPMDYKSFLNGLRGAEICIGK